VIAPLLERLWDIVTLTVVLVVVVVGCSCVGRILLYHCHGQHWMLVYIFVLLFLLSLFESEIKALPANVEAT
jgi:hypothetical protein